MACAECGCVVEHGAVVVRCGTEGCCCSHLPDAEDGEDDRSADRPSVARPSWSTPREAVAVVLYRPHLRATTRIAAIVGSVLFAINQLDVVLTGRATTVTWLKSALTYLVPFTVSNLGILTATRQANDDRSDGPTGSTGG